MTESPELTGPKPKRARRPSLRVPVEDPSGGHSSLARPDLGVTAVASAAVVVVRGSAPPSEFKGDFAGGESYYDAMSVSLVPQGELGLESKAPAAAKAGDKVNVDAQSMEQTKPTTPVAAVPGAAAVPASDDSEPSIEIAEAEDDEGGLESREFRAEGPLLGSDPVAVEPVEGVLATEAVAAVPPPPPARGSTPPPRATSDAPKKIPPPPPRESQATPPPKREKAEPARDMATVPEATPSGKKAWFETVFDEDFLRTTRAPSAAAVSHQCDFIVKELGIPAGGSILDVGAGQGLQAVELARRGYKVTALDLSESMLSHAKMRARDASVDVNLVHGDMRSMAYDGSFDAVLCWGTSFGYFEDDMNRRVMELLHNAVRPGGYLLLDVANRDFVIGNQPNLVWFEGDRTVCIEETSFNYVTSRLLVKRTVIREDGYQYEHFYSLRLYSLHELGQLMHHRGFRVARVSSYEAAPGAFFGFESPRMLVLAERRQAPKGQRSVDGRESGRPVTRNDLPPVPGGRGAPASADLAMTIPDAARPAGNGDGGSNE
jgi:SAM-dependent methyltransferase